VTAKERRFIAEYMIDANGAAAARRAGYSEHSARDIAAELMRKPDVRAEVKRRQAAAAKRLEITADAIKRELHAIGFARINHVASYGARGLQAKDFAELEPQHLAAIAEINSDGGRVKVKMHNKIEALALLAKLCGFTVDRHEHDIRTGKLEIYLPDNGRRPRSA
jgi:phage terminase small subunit